MLAQSLARTPLNTVSIAPVASMFADDMVFRKTIAGHREFDLRKMPLRAELRRLLILIDGKRGVRSLAQCFRAGDVLPLLSELRDFGLIDATDQGASFAEFTADEALDQVNPLSREQFEAVRSVAMYAAGEMLGSASLPSRLAMSLCQDQRGMRAILTELETQLVTTIGRDAATLFFAAVRDASAGASAKARAS
jgi:hypothetical protein